MLSSGEVFAGFTVERLLGQGGMGSVYLAGHPRLPLRMALKLLNPELFSDKEIRARFEREADLAAGLNHANIVTVYDRGSESGQPWIAMQYVEGHDAAQIDPPTLTPQRGHQIIEGVAAALDFAHSHGVLHRDVKPANILLEQTSGDHPQRVFLTDFGIARLREDSTRLTRTGTFTATLAYASPEQMTGAPIGPHSDQYSLACTLYWLLTGSGPFDAPHPGEVIRGHLQLEPPPVNSRRAELPTTLDAVFTVALAKRPEERFRSCLQFAEAARQALSTAPQPYPGASLEARLAPTMRRIPAPNEGKPDHSGAASPYPQAAQPVRGLTFTPEPQPPIDALDRQSPQLPLAPDKRRKRWLVGGILLAVAGLVLGTVTVIRSLAPTGSTTSDPTKLAFPKFLPPGDAQSGTGFQNAHCTLNSYFTDQPGSPTFARYQSAWGCTTTVGKPDYLILRYATSSEVQSVLTRLTKPDKSDGSNGSTYYTNYNLPLASGRPVMVTAFPNAAKRANFLIYTRGLDFPDQLKSWMRETAPLN
ncbi:serine/threonine protein kinase [Nocardia sp. NPDC052566]|uniref:serine/threonine protein kinase n=1 Tax=Nocardia sp. NPDC052566 TaxID=3364330 RepID=UPI0037C617DC